MVDNIGDKQLTYDEFLKELESLKVWISKQTRNGRSWAFSVSQYFEGSR